MNSLEKEQAFERALAETLRNAIEHEVMGEQNGDGLLGRVETHLRRLHYPNGPGSTEIYLETTDEGLLVSLTLPPKAPRVGVIRFEVSSG